MFSIKRYKSVAFILIIFLCWIGKEVEPFIISADNSFSDNSLGDNLTESKSVSYQQSAPNVNIKGDDSIVEGKLIRRRHRYGQKQKFGKMGKGKRYSRILYPIIAGLMISGMVIFPIVLKIITFMSTAAFVFSKMSFVGTIMLGLKWFLTHSNTNQPMRPESPKVEIVHVPTKKQNSDWDRETDTYKSSNENNVYNDYYSKNYNKPPVFTRKML